MTLVSVVICGASLHKHISYLFCVLQMMLSVLHLCFVSQLSPHFTVLKPIDSLHSINVSPSSTRVVRWRAGDQGKVSAVISGKSSHQPTGSVAPFVFLCLFTVSTKESHIIISDIFIRAWNKIRKLHTWGFHPSKQTQILVSCLSKCDLTKSCT